VLALPWRPQGHLPDVTIAPRPLPKSGKERGTRPRAKSRALATVRVVSHPGMHLHPFLAKPEDKLPSATPDEQFVIARSTTSAISG